MSTATGESAFVAYIRKRLPNTDFVTTADVCSAFQYDESWVRQLRDAGAFGHDCVKAPGRSGRWQIPHKAVLDHAAKFKGDDAIES